MQATCPVCRSTTAESFVTVPRVPVLCNILWPTRAAATGVQRVDVDLAFCAVCGHIFNPGFDPDLMDYSQVYENSLHFSPTFQEYADSLSRELVARHDLHGKQIVEIGSGKGDFLEMLCELGDNRGHGFDPSYLPGETARSKTDQITFVQDFYTEQYADVPADFICCRHTLEHIPEPRPFMAMLRRTIGNRPDLKVVFEVPNAVHTLRDLAIWDIIYEHCSYYTKYSLAHLFAVSGFAVTDVREVYGGQFLLIEATPAVGSTLADQASWNRPAELAADVAAFGDHYRQKVAEERTRLDGLAAQHHKAVVWGAGSKGITYLNVLNPGDCIDYAVDINPRKQGMFVTGTGQQIVAPDSLTAVKPDLVLVMNPLYRDEIRRRLAEIGVDAAVIAV